MPVVTSLGKAIDARFAVARPMVVLLPDGVFQHLIGGHWFRTYSNR